MLWCMYLSKIATNFSNSFLFSSSLFLSSLADFQNLLDLKVNKQYNTVELNNYIKITFAFVTEDLFAFILHSS
jgi:hypothetical protein